MILRAVFDTSTLVSAALRPDSIPDQALSHGMVHHQVLSSRNALEELERVLARDKFDRYMSREARAEFIRRFRRDVVLCEVSAAEIQLLSTACRDPYDAPFLALALAAKASLIVSSDADLLTLHPWRGIPILTPAQFLEQ